MTPIEVRPEMTIIWPGFQRIDQRQLLIYIASPYQGDVVSNVRFACEIGDKILAKGHIPYIPHLNHLWDFISPKPRDEWLRIDNIILPKCDALLRVGGVSQGADAEVVLADHFNIPVYFTLDTIPKYIP